MMVIPVNSDCKPKFSIDIDNFDCCVHNYVQIQISRSDLRQTRKFVLKTNNEKALL